MSKQTILIVEDEHDIIELLTFNLQREGYLVESSATGEDGLNRAKAIVPDLILLDIMLPGLNGLDVCRNLKSDNKTKDIPVIMLTAREEDIDIVTGLELGADDYIIKPFSPKVLIARIRTVLRRRANLTEEALLIWKFDELVINKEKHKVTLSGNPIELTQTEFEILCLLANRPGWVFSRSQIIDSLRDGQQVITERAIDVQIVNLRKKLGSAGDYIQTVRGVGYRMKETS